jgi:hypothetical protein
MTIDDGKISNISGLTFLSGAATAGQYLQATDSIGGVQWATIDLENSTSLTISDTLTINKLIANGSAGTAGQYLVSGGAGANAHWQDFPTSVANWTVTTSLVSSTASSLAAATCTTLTASGNVTALKLVSTSDERLKEDIEPLKTDIEKLLALKPIKYRFKGGSEKQNGFSAQNVKKNLDDIVETFDDGTLGMDYNGLIPHLLNAIKHLNKKVAHLESQLFKRCMK